MVTEELIREIFHIEDQTLIQELSAISTIENFQKRQTIYDIGEKHTHFYILLSGIAYTWFPDEKQRLNTTCFFLERGNLLNVEGINKITAVGAKALVDSEVCMIPIEKARLLFDQYPALIWSYIRGLQKMMIYLCVVNNQRMHLTAEERYRWFCEKWPTIDELATNQQIASFLMIRPESLSRLRAQLKQSAGNKDKEIANVLVSKDMKLEYLDIRQKIDEI